MKLILECDEEYPFYRFIDDPDVIAAREAWTMCSPGFVEVSPEFLGRYRRVMADFRSLQKDMSLLPGWEE